MKRLWCRRFHRWRWRKIVYGTGELSHYFCPECLTNRSAVSEGAVDE